MIAKAIDKIDAEQVAKANEGKKAPEIKVGDSVKVFVRIKEGGKERLQAFAGTVIARDNGSGNTATFGPSHLVRRGRREGLPAELAVYRPRRGGAFRPRASRQALLPA